MAHRDSVMWPGMVSNCCTAYVVQRSSPSMFFSRDVWICGNCGHACTPTPGNIDPATQNR